jgi:hypothetical protein
MEKMVNDTKKSGAVITFFRFLSMFGCLFGIFYAVFSCLIVGRISHSFSLGIAVSIFFGYPCNRFKLFQSISDEQIVLKWKSNRLAIPINEIKSISKNYRFTFTDDFMWILRVKGGRFSILNFYIFPNNKEYDLKTLFENAGIPLKNMP